MFHFSKKLHFPTFILFKSSSYKVSIINNNRWSQCQCESELIPEALLPFINLSCFMTASELLSEIQLCIYSWAIYYSPCYSNVFQGLSSFLSLWNILSTCSCIINTQLTTEDVSQKGLHGQCFIHLEFRLQLQTFDGFFATSSAKLITQSS